MQYAVFSDIHGNLSALQAVWNALTTLRLTDRPIFNAGDNVGYGDAPEECTEFLRSYTNIVTVQGNYDKNVAQFAERETEFHRKWGKSRPEKFSAIRRDSEIISVETRDWLLNLQKEMEFTLEGIPMLLTHYAPGVKEGLGQWTSDRRLRELAGQTHAKIVICGHTHTPFARVAEGVLFLNPGTVGRSWHDGCAYAILTLNSGNPPTAQLYHTGKH